jgi:hypothetical protein
VNLLRLIDRFFLGVAVALDNVTVDLCRLADQSIPVGVYRRRRQWMAGR